MRGVTCSRPSGLCDRTSTTFRFGLIAIVTATELKRTYRSSKTTPIRFFIFENGRRRHPHPAKRAIGKIATPELLTNPAALNAANSSTVVSPPPARYIERPCQHRAHIITIASARTASGAALAAPLKLRFDSCLIDDGPYRSDFPVVELVKHILRKRHLANLKAEELPLGVRLKWSITGTGSAP